jgi:hypothetical protein
MSRKVPKKDPAKALTAREFLGEECWSELSTEEEQVHEQNVNAAIGLFGLDTATGRSRRYNEKLWDELREWWIFDLLVLAKNRGDTENFKRILHFFVRRIVGKPPKGVFLPFRWPRGRPQDEQVTEILLEWVNRGQPHATSHECSKIAVTLWPEYKDAEKKEQKRMRDRVYAAIRRRATKTP